MTETIEDVDAELAPPGPIELVASRAGYAKMMLLSLCFAGIFLLDLVADPGSPRLAAAAMFVLFGLLGLGVSYRVYRPLRLILDSAGITFAHHRPPVVIPWNRLVGFRVQRIDLAMRIDERVLYKAINDDHPEGQERVFGTTFGFEADELVDLLSAWRKWALRQRPDRMPDVDSK